MTSHRHEHNYRLVLSLLRALRHDAALERLRRPLAVLLDAALAYTREPGGVLVGGQAPGVSHVRMVYELCKAAEDITRAITGDPGPYAPPTVAPLSATDPRVLSMLADAPTLPAPAASPPPTRACPTCDGTGWSEAPCITCDGSGWCKDGAGVVPA